jgi:proteic killer suppression protein
VIRHFRHKGLKRLYEKNDTSQIRPDHVEKVENILVVLDAAGSIGDVDLPGLHLHPLRGDFKGFWAVTIRANWRIIFRFENGEVFDVDYVDYH